MKAWRKSPQCLPVGIERDSSLFRLKSDYVSTNFHKNVRFIKIEIVPSLEYELFDQMLPTKPVNKKTRIFNVNNDISTISQGKFLITKATHWYIQEP